MVKIIDQRQAKPRKPFIRIGDKIRYLGSSNGLGNEGEPILWVRTGEEGVVIEFHNDGKIDYLLEDEEDGKWWDEAEDWAVVKFPNGRKIAIQKNDKGKGWEAI